MSQKKRIGILTAGGDCPGLNIVGIPKTIDNDVWGTELAFEFDSAVTTAADAIDRLHSTANSHKRIMVVEVMGQTQAGSPCMQA